MSYTPFERWFSMFLRGEVRDNVRLAFFRNALRASINPDTDTYFTEDEITRATQPGSRFYIEADADDLTHQTLQGRALFLVDQLRPTRANTAFLEGFHSPMWLGEDEGRLPATGGSGTVSAPATTGSIFVGSATLGDPVAAVATDPNGYRYQVLTTVTTPGSGTATLSMQAVDGGVNTNPASGTVLTWSANQPLGAEPTALTAADFSGGFDAETDQELAERIEQRMRHRPGAGNAAHFEAWARSVSTAIESAFVYPCALQAGSVVVCVLQKRNAAASPPEGPLVRANPSIGTMTAAIAYLTPPASSVVPEHVYVLVVTPATQYVDLSLELSMNTGSDGGWADATPWPEQTATYDYADIGTLSDQQHFTITTDAALPGGSPLSGSDCPSIMAWDRSTSRWEQLSVASMSQAGAVVTVVLSVAPTQTLAVGTRISPYTELHEIAAEAIEAYFDGLGPGEIVDTSADPTAARAARFPAPTSSYPFRAGSLICSRVVDALGGAAADCELLAISPSPATPTVPAEAVDGPNLLVCGHVGIYPAN